MRQFIDDIKDYSNLLPFLGAYLILYGSVDLITYYGEFNINIVSYIGFAEIISYFIRDIYVVTIHVGVVIFSIVFFDPMQEKLFGGVNKILARWTENRTKAEKILSTIDKESVTPEDRQKLMDVQAIMEQTKQDAIKAKRQTRKLKIFLVIFSVPLLVVLGWYITRYGPLSGVRFVIPLVISLVIGNFVSNFKLFMVTYGLVSLISSAYFNAISNADKVKSGKNFGMDIKIDDKLIKSDSANFVIGKTDNYVFYYETKTSMTTVYPVSKLNYMTIPNR